MCERERERGGGGGQGKKGGGISLTVFFLSDGQR